MRFGVGCLLVLLGICGAARADLTYRGNAVHPGEYFSNWKKDL